MVNRSRESGVELLRIALMFCIIIHHLIDWGGGFNTIPKAEWTNTFGTYQKIFLFSFFRFVTVCFIFISSYYGIRLKFKRLLELWLECFFYSITILLVCGAFNLAPMPNSAKEYLKFFLPITGNSWWFITTYFELTLLSPVINYFLKNMPFPWLKYFLIFGLVVNFIPFIPFIPFVPFVHVTNLILFIFVYSLGYYLHHFELTFTPSRTKLLFGYFLSGLLLALGGIGMVFLYNSAGAVPPLEILWSDGNPVIIFSAICVFYLFKSLKIQSRIINYLGKLSVAVYLIHVHPLIIKNIIPGLWGIDVLSENWYYLFALLLYAAIILIFCYVVELVRYKIMLPMVKRLQNLIIWEPPLSHVRE